MTDYAIKIVDAFTSVPFAGNPCGVVTRAEGLSDAQMQAIAREMNLSETAFVFPSERAGFRVRFFTPRAEIPLAGHPTIATMFTLADEGRIPLTAGHARVTQETGAGVLPVDIVANPGGGFRVVMTQAAPVFLHEIDRVAAAAALRLSVEDLHPSLPAQVVSTGTPQGMIPVGSLDVLRRLRPDFEALAALEASGGFFSTHVFTTETLDPAHATHARHYLGAQGFEDPVTGSATGGMAAYLWRHGVRRQPAFVAEQGHLMGRPGLVDVEVEGAGDTPTTVRIAGTAVTVLRGTISA
ncbi:MAG: PhzF family phenazine biosynthesis protein [Dehalococcoidia bacterium]